MLYFVSIPAGKLLVNADSEVQAAQIVEACGFGYATDIIPAAVTAHLSGNGRVWILSEVEHLEGSA